MVKFINNSESDSHLSCILDLLPGAEEAYIMVAFLKMSGLSLVMPQLTKVKNLKLIAGANFGYTEPAALNLLFEEAQRNTRFSAFINRLDSKQIFHPKMYLIRTGKKGHILIGSANMTKGGLEHNNECSIYTQCLVTDQIWLDTLGHFKRCIDPEHADVLSKRIIAIYREYYKKQKIVNEKADGFPDVSVNHFYDLAKLRSRFESLNKLNIRLDLKQKENCYREAREVLDKIASQKHSAVAFKDMIEDLVGKPKLPGLWYSNGLYRGKEDIFKQQEKFRKLVSNIKSNLHESPKKIYSDARKLSKDIYKLGPNYIGEIMMTYAPEKLANINRNPITVLRDEGGVIFKAHSQSFNGDDYEEYNSIVKDIAHKLGLKNMIAADYFFNEVFQELKKTNKEKQ